MWRTKGEVMWASTYQIPEGADPEKFGAEKIEQKVGHCGLAGKP